MAHLLEARRGGAVADTKVALAKDQYHFTVDVLKWDDAKENVAKLGDRRFTLPVSLYRAFTVNHLKERLSPLLPPVTAGGELNGSPFQDDSTLTSLGVQASEGNDVEVFFVFNIDKNASAASAASPRAADAAGSLSRTTSVAVKAGSGPITPDRELSAVLSLFQDSGNNYVTVTASNATAGINFEGKVQIADSYWTSMTVKELKRKLNGFPSTSDRGTLTIGTATKNIKDTDKWGALGVKGKRGDTLKFNLTFELPGSSTSSGAAPVAVVTGEPAPEIEAKQQFRVEMSTSLLEGNVFLKFVCTSDVVPEIVKSAALPKMTFSVFNVNDVHQLLKGPQYPILVPSWAAFDGPNGKIKVAKETSLTKLGITYGPQSTTYRFIFVIDPNAALPNVDK